MCMLASLPGDVRDTAREAVNEMDRMPVSDTYAGMFEALSKGQDQGGEGSEDTEDDDEEDEEDEEEDEEEGDDLTLALSRSEGSQAPLEFVDEVKGGDLSSEVLPDSIFEVEGQGEFEVIFKGDAPAADWLASGADEDEGEGEGGGGP